MAGRPRGDVIREDEVGAYHVWTRCVRRYFLCGFDPLTGRDFSHRKLWFQERLQELAQIFAVDACVWAILSNHYHLILRNRPDLAMQWTDEEVARRWWRLYPERRDEDGRPAEPTPAEIRSICSNRHRVAALRRRLRSISWFMKSLNEWFAKRANAETGDKGHFWQERFGARNLLDEGAILVCSIYIDLNEIRAQLAATPETSPNTSAYHRILSRILRRARKNQGLSPPPGPGEPDYQMIDPDFWMCPLDEHDRAPLLGSVDASAAAVAETPDGAGFKTWRHGFLPLTVDQYLAILDRTGRQLVAGKRGAIDADLAPILERLGIRPGVWLDMLENFDRWFRGAVGQAERLMEFASRTGRRWIHGLDHCRQSFS